LLQKIFERSGRHADLLSILENNELKLQHKFLADKQEFSRMKVDLLFQAKLWEQLFEFSKQAIENGLNESGMSSISSTNCRPDRMAYESLLKAGDQLSKVGPLTSRSGKMTKLTHMRLDLRFSHVLAIVSWYAENEASEPLCQNGDSNIPSSLPEACSHYFKMFGSKPC
jgi:hypothetical protein